MSGIHRLRMTIASMWYDSREEYQREYELHFLAARRGKLKTTRRALARRGLQYFQQQIYRKYGIWVPKRRIRVSFEREERASRTDRRIVVNARTMRFRGKHHSATALPSRVISYVRRRFAKRKHA